jgi:hypothetical protein
MVDYGWSWLITSSFERHNFALDGILFPEMDGDIWRHGDDSNDSQGVTAGLGECLVYESISIATYRGMWEIYGNIWKYVIEHQLFKVTLKLSPLTSHNRCQDLRKVWTNLRTSAAGISCRQPGWVRAEMGFTPHFPSCILHFGYVWWGLKLHSQRMPNQTHLCCETMMFKSKAQVLGTNPDEDSTKKTWWSANGRVHCKVSMI